MCLLVTSLQVFWGIFSWISVYRSVGLSRSSTSWLAYRMGRNFEQQRPYCLPALKPWSAWSLALRQHCSLLHALAPDMSVSTISSTSLCFQIDLLIPEDAVLLGETISAAVYPSVSCNYIQVRVSSVDSPGKFWFQLDAMHNELELLMADLQWVTRLLPCLLY